MRIGEADSLICQPVEVRGRDLGFGIKGSQVTISHVIGKNENDVRVLGLEKELAAQQYKQEGDWV